MCSKKGVREREGSEGVRLVGPDGGGGERGGERERQNERGRKGQREKRGGGFTSIYAGVTRGARKKRGRGERKRGRGPLTARALYYIIGGHFGPPKSLSEHKKYEVLLGPPFFRAASGAAPFGSYRNGERRCAGESPKRPAVARAR